MKSFRKIAPLLVLCSVLSWALAAGAHAAVEDYVPADAAVVVKVTDLESHYRDFVDGPLWARLKDPTFLPELAASLAEAERGMAEFETVNEVDVEGVLLDILGREFALAFFPDESGALIVEAGSARTLRRAVEEFRRVERNTENFLYDESSDYRGVTVHTVALRDKKRYHALSGEVLIVSEQRAALERALDVVEGRADPIGGSPDFREALQMAPRDALAVTYVGEAVMGALAEQMQRRVSAPRPRARREREPLRSLMAEVLPLVRFAVLSVENQDALRARLTVSYRGDGLPERLRALLPEPGSGMAVADVIPPGAVFAGVRSLNARGVWDLLIETTRRSAPAQARKLEAGLDQMVTMVGGVHSREQLLEELAGQMALVLLPAAAQGNPPMVGAAVRLRETAHIPLALESIVGAAVTFARAEGKHELALESTDYMGTRLSTLLVDKPGPWRTLSPTFGLVGSNLIVASTREAAREMVDAARSRTRVRMPRIEGTPYSSGVLNLGAAADMVAEYRQFLVRQAVREEGKPEHQVRAELSAFEKLLSLLDTAQFAAAYEQSNTHHEITITFAQLRP